MFDRTDGIRRIEDDDEDDDERGETKEIAGGFKVEPAR